MPEKFQQPTSQILPTAKTIMTSEKRLITEIDLRIAAAPATIQPNILEHALIDEWQEYRLHCSAHAAPPSSPNHPVAPFDHYRIYRNCNSLIEHNSDLNINNHHLAIVFFQRGKPVRLFLGFDEDLSVLPSIQSKLEKFHPHTAAPTIIGKTCNLEQKPITNPKFNQNLPEDQVFPCANISQLRSYLKQLSLQDDSTTCDPQFNYLSTLHLICYLDLPGRAHPGYRFKITYMGGLFDPKARIIFPFL